MESKYPDRYQNLYPVTKIVDELFSRHFSLRNEVDCVSLRYFNKYGPGKNTKGAYASPISKFISSAFKGEDIEVFGDGTQSRDFIYVKNLFKNYLMFTQANMTKTTVELKFKPAFTIKKAISKIIQEK